jgi:peptide/nickel transport system permease protein
MKKKNIFRKTNYYILVGGLLVLLSVFSAIAAPVLTSYSPTDMAPYKRLSAPSEEHIMGTDEFGRDVFSRVLYGTRNSLQVAVMVVLIVTVTGIIVGLLIGYYDKLDKIVSRILDAMMAFPEIIIAISLAAVWGGGKTNIIMSMSFAYFSRMARVVRGSTISVRELDFVEASRAIGNNNTNVIFRHILPNVLSPIIVQATFVFAYAILVEATLSFLGVGIRPPEPSLGGMLSDGRNIMMVASWLVIYPGIAIIMAALGFNLLGDGLRDLLDPRIME